jgi:Tol biopolymer transport system component
MLIRRSCWRCLPIVALLASLSLALADEGAKPQGEKTTYQGNSPLMIMTIDGKELHELTFVPGYEEYGSPLWSHDGSKVAFDAHVGNLSTTHSFIVGLDGVSPLDLGDGAMPSWAPGDQRLTIHRYNDNWGIWAIQPDGTGLERLTTRGNSPRWSPDGIQIAHLGYEEERGGEHGIKVYNTLEGTDEFLLRDRELGHGFTSAELGFQWSPDGRRLGLTANHSDGGVGVFIYTLEGPQRGLKLRLTADKDCMGLGVAWSPDGKEALISLRTKADRALQVYRLEVDTEAAPVRLPGQPADRSASDLAWSPDGKWVLFSSGPAD